MENPKINPEYYRFVVENSPVSVIITNPDGKIIYVNPAAETITGYLSSETIGNTPRLWGNQMDLKFYSTFWDIIKNKKQSYVGELINKRKDGRKYIARILVKPVLNHKQEVIAYVGNEEDITDWILSEQKERELIKELEKQDKSHEQSELKRKITKLEYNNPDAVKITGDCKEEEAFWTEKGAIVRNAYSLISALEGMSEFEFRYHVNKDNNKNDFADWIRDVFGDEELALLLENIMDKEKYINIIKNRLKNLEEHQ